MAHILHPLPGRLWVVRLSEVIASQIKNHVTTWPRHHRDDLGDQIVRSSDSIGANISEGYVRIHVKERLHFFSIAQGSLEEALFHLRRARNRGLVTRLEAFTISGLLVKLSKGIDNLRNTQTPRD